MPILPSCAAVFLPPFRTRPASLGFRFDETIDSIEGAARAYGYVLERWRLPASEQAENAKPPDTSKTISGRHDADERKPKPADKAPEPAGGDPGLLGFPAERRLIPRGACVRSTCFWSF